MLSNGRAASESEEVLVQRVLHRLLPPPPREDSLGPARWIELAELELHDEGELRHRQRGPERLLPSFHPGRLMNINPRGALRPLRNKHKSNPDHEKDSPSDHCLRGLLALLEHFPQVHRQVPEEHHREELYVDMEVGAEARFPPWILRRGPRGMHIAYSSTRPW